MKLIHILLAFLSLVLITGQGAFALEDSQQAREKLARQFHRINPPSKIIDAAINVAASSLQNEQEKARYIKSMQILVDTEAAEMASMKALTTTFSADELEFLVDIYSSEIGVRTLAKVPAYQQIITPEISKILDNALLTMKTGGGSDFKR